MKSIKPLPKNGWYAVSDKAIALNQVRRVVLFHTPLIILREDEEQFHVYFDACPHRGYPLSDGALLSNNKLMCKYHGWCFNKKGECSSVPGLKNIPRYKLKRVNSKLHDGLIWVNLSPEMEFDITHKRPALNKEFTWNYHLNVPSYLLIENTLDPMHTPYIHAGLVRSETKNKKSVEIIIRNNDKLVEAVYKNEGEQSGLISKLFSPPDVDGIGRFINPSILELEFKSPHKTYISFTAYLNPVSEDKVNVMLKVNYAHLPLRLDFFVRPLFKLMLRKVVKQDIDVCLKQYKNLKKFPDFKYSSSKLDYMIPFIDSFLEGRPRESGVKELTIFI